MSVRLVGWSVGQSVSHNFPKVGKLQFHDPIKAYVYFDNVEYMGECRHVFTDNYVRDVEYLGRDDALVHLELASESWHLNKTEL